MTVKPRDEGWGALAGLKVLDLGVLLAAPMAATFLGDWGAEVIKVEHPMGDPLRNWAPSRNGVGLWWKVTGRNKKCVTLNLNDPRAQQIAFRLAAMSDVVIENFRPGTLERWNLGYDRLKDANPRLILLRITGYGQFGPYAQRPGYGTIAEAMSGIPSFTGFEAGPPVFPPFPLADSVSAVFGASAVLAALYSRQKTGIGQVIDLALYESVFRLAESQVIGFDQLGLVKQRVGNRIEEDAPRNAYVTLDGGWIAISASSESTFERLCTAIGQPELARDARFVDNRSRVKNVEELDRIIGAWFQKTTATEAMGVLSQNDVVAGPVYDIRDIFMDPHYKARENIVSIDDADLGTIRMQGTVPNFSNTPGRVVHAGESLGQHNEEIYCGRLGMSREDLESLKRDGTI